MFLPLVPGQDLAKEYFLRAIERGRLSHAYLFWGPEGTGKRLFARELSKALFCSAGTPCGACASCLSIEHNNHPSVNVYGPAEGKSIIDIDTVREFCQRTHYRSSQLEVDILERADLLNEPAANALLKTLEEPPERCILILTAQSTGSLPATIVSRCHRVPFQRSMARGAALSSEERALVSDVARPGFFAHHEPREWLESIAPAQEGARNALRGLLERLVEEWRAKLPLASGREMDDALRRAGAFIELRQDLDRNVHPDLVLEKLLWVLRADAGT